MIRVVDSGIHDLAGIIGWSMCRGQKNTWMIKCCLFGCFAGQVEDDMAMIGTMTGCLVCMEPSGGASRPQKQARLHAVGGEAVGESGVASDPTLMNLDGFLIWHFASCPSQQPRLAILFAINRVDNAHSSVSETHQCKDYIS